MYQGPTYKRETNPRDTSWFLSLLTFMFTLKIFKKGYKNEIQEEDLYDVIKKYKSSKLGEEFEERWKHEMTRPKPSMTKFLFRKFGKTIICWGFLKLTIRVTYTVLKPLAVGRLVSYFSPGSTLTLTDAYAFAGMITVILLIQPSFNQTYYLRLTEAAQQMRIGLCSLVYRKSLKLTTSSLTEITNGKIVTLITKDAMQFEMMIPFVNEIWIGSIQVVVMTYVMYKQIGISALIGVGFLLCLTPLQGFIARLTMKTKMSALAKSDERIRLTHEILSTIQIIKIYTWENYFKKLVDSIRTKEVFRLRMMYYLKVIIIALGHMSTKISFYICLLSYILIHDNITAEKAFVVLSCYGGIQHALSIAIPMTISHFAELKSSLKRIKEFLLAAEVESDETEGGTNIYQNTQPELYSGDKEKSLKPYTTEPPIVKAVELSVEILRNKPILSNVNLNISSGLNAICGPVGCGKSTLLRALLSDLRIVDGKLHVTGSISYASQDPWLFPGTIRQNILFGLPYDDERYNKVVDICGLRRDFEILINGDNTVLRDRGLNLSKGQQARVNLARAIYKNADIYLLDNPLAALDATVSKQVFETCFKDFLSDKICIIVMHQVQFLQEVNQILVMKDGTFVSQGTYEELSKIGITFGGDFVEENTKGDEAHVERESTESNDGDADENTKLLSEEIHVEKASKLYDENKKQGKVDWDIYKAYFKYGGGWKAVPLMVFLGVGTQAFLSGFEYFISYWINIEEQLYVLKQNGTTNTTEYEETITAKEMIPLYYSILLMLATTFNIANSIYLFILFAIANKRLHNHSFWKVMQAPMAFFDQNLSGNILNRFTKDINTIDEQIPILFYQCIRLTLIVIGIIVLVSVVKWGFLLLSIAFAVVLAILQRIYLPTSRSLKRLDGVTRSPVVGHLNASLDGLTTIRASGIEDILIQQFDKHQDLHSSASYMYLSTSRAFGFYADTMCVGYAMIVMFSLLMFGNTNAGKVGLALNLAFGLGTLLQYCTRQWTELENQMTCIERVLEYSEIKSESKEGIKPPNWPTEGGLQFLNVEMKYPKTNQLVLKGLNFTVEKGQKIGIIGRTGAGKTSIISALFRLYETSEGSIFIDGINIHEIALDHVRSKISIIPQIPILFSGTVRNNLDPNHEYEDSYIWKALEDVGMKKAVTELHSELEHKIEDGGSNFSSGQKQLICLARAILKNNKIIVLDEATANIDPETDVFVQETIKKKFGHCTILMIAHRLNSVLDSDKVMVVNNGNIVEFDRPDVLLSNKESSFYYLVSQSGLLKSSNE